MPSSRGIAVRSPRSPARNRRRANRSASAWSGRRVPVERASEGMGQESHRRLRQDGAGTANHMAVVYRDMTAPPEAVFDVFDDGWLYGLWVVGASHIRDVDQAWPAVGSHIPPRLGARAPRAPDHAH